MLMQIQGVSYTYAKKSRPAISDLSLNIDEGEIIAVVGRTSCGKTTLGNLITGVIPGIYTDGKLENKYFIVEGVERARQEYHGPNEIKVMYSEWNDYVKPATLDKIFQGHFPGFEYEHAAVNETSLMLALCPDKVVFHEYPEEYAERYINYFVWPASPDLATRNGALSSAKNSSVENGKLMLADIAEGMLRDIEIEFGGVNKDVL